MRLSSAAVEASRRDIAAIEANVARVVRGKPQAVRLAVAALLARGHLLIEDVPGVGKTTLARALARSIDGTFRRVQFTSDLLPSDLLGVGIWDAARREFEFRPGPVFGNVVLADELNRAMPKTQGALLEAMGERGVTVDGTTHALAEPFLVLATQNPAESHGTFPLPESELDRFLLRLPMGYPDREAEREILAARPGPELVEELEPVVSLAEVLALQREVDEVQVADPILDYVVDLLARTRSDPALHRGASPRGGQALVRAARALARVEGRAFVVPDDVQALAVPALAHRVQLADESQGRAGAEAAIRRIVSEVAVPA